MKNIIMIKKKYLVFRNEAKKILENILKINDEEKNLKSIYLDFSGVAFISRSFSDELLNMVNHLGSQKVLISIINLKPKLQKLINKVKKTKEKIRKEMELSVVDK